MSASQRRRVWLRAAAAWQDGRPYTAWAELADAGLSEHWKEFRQEALRAARTNYLRRVRTI